MELARGEGQQSDCHLTKEPQITLASGLQPLLRHSILMHILVGQRWHMSTNASF